MWEYALPRPQVIELVIGPRQPALTTAFSRSPLPPRLYSHLDATQYNCAPKPGMLAACNASRKIALRSFEAATPTELVDRPFGHFCYDEHSTVLSPSYSGLPNDIMGNSNSKNEFCGTPIWYNKKHDTLFFT